MDQRDDQPLRAGLATATDAAQAAAAMQADAACAAVAPTLRPSAWSTRVLPAKER